MLYSLVFLTAAVVSAVLTRADIELACRMGWLDRPSPRRVHLSPTPRLGGVAMFLAFGAVVLVATAAGWLRPYTSLGFLSCCAALTIVGGVDDVYDLPTRTKFLFQVAAVVVMVAGFDVVMRHITLPLVGTVFLDGTVPGYVATVFWILGMINTVNFADGIDGLAGGLAVIFALVMWITGVTLHQAEIPFYAAALGGVALGFLRYNFAPARIFMGDSGSMFLGFCIGTLSILGTAKIVTALLIMGVPIADVAYSILRRVRAGEPFHRPDKEHLHHKLLTLGLSQRTTSLAFYVLALAFGGLALIPQRTGRLAALVVLSLCTVGIILWVDMKLRRLRPLR